MSFLARFQYVLLKDYLIEMINNNASIPAYRDSYYRNQFILGPSFIEEFTSWQKIAINTSMCLSVHPHLNMGQTCREDKSITLLGFVLDPDKPQADDAEILDELMNKLSSCDRFLDHTFKLGGRWILIVNDGREIRLFNDAAGLRQVFYTDVNYTKDLWCASQPEIIAAILNLKMDQDAVDFIDSYEFRKNKEFRWPGYGSPYKEIKHMLPNHSINLKTGLCLRYWPDGPLPYLPLNQAIEKISATFKNLMKSASHRFDLALSVTAGLDSRLVLAASKEMSKSVSYMTVRQIDKPDNHPDVTIPSLLFSKLGLKHDIVKSSLILNDEFVKVFKKNVTLAHYIYASDAQAILNYYNRSKVAVTGSASEIARSSFRSQLNKPKTEEVTAQDLATLQAMGGNQFAISSFENWLSGLGEIYNLDVLDLFEWEQGHGNWLAMCQLEFDIAWKDIFTPFNCRSLLINMLSVKEKYRKKPKYELFEKLILNLWPEVLSVPINPHKNKNFFSVIKSHIPRPVKRKLRQLLQVRL
jgi:hypothetical protein